ncbi:hypothetical protein GCM10027268_20350 [Brachybacterium huguangmaarense]
MTHRNAPLTPLGRQRAVAQVLERGRPIAHVAAEFRIARSTLSKWVTRAAREIGAVTPRTVGPEDLTAFLAKDSWSAATRRSNRASLALFFHWQLATGGRPDDPLALLPPVRVPRKIPRPIPDDLITSTLLTADPRTRLMILLGAEAGLRRAEIAAVRREDIGGPRGAQSLFIRGKGMRERLLPISDRLETDLRLWEEPTWLFPSPRGAGPIGAIRVGELVSEALPGHWTCHSLRHRFATQTYRASHNLLLVQQLMGHSKPETTAAYIGVDLTAAALVVQASSLTF